MTKAIMVFAILIQLCLNTRSNAQSTTNWTQVNGPWGGKVNSMESFGGYLWANSPDGGIYRLQ